MFVDQVTISLKAVMVVMVSLPIEEKYVPFGGPVVATVVRAHQLF